MNYCVKKCIANIFHSLFSAELDQKNFCMFSCECPSKTDLFITLETKLA
jgi:hypothetical protein